MLVGDGNNLVLKLRSSLCCEGNTISGGCVVLGDVPDEIMPNLFLGCAGLGLEVPRWFTGKNFMLPVFHLGNPLTEAACVQCTSEVAQRSGGHRYVCGANAFHSARPCAESKLPGPSSSQTHFSNSDL